MNVEEFYDENPQRRRSEELEFGNDWDDGGGRCQVSWIADTGEVYAMGEPRGGLVSDIFGDEAVPEMSEKDIRVAVLGTVNGRDNIEHVMSGWESAMNAANSLDWVRQRIANAANEGGDPPASPSRDLPKS